MVNTLDSIMVEQIKYLKIFQNSVIILNNIITQFRYTSNKIVYIKCIPITLN